MTTPRLAPSGAMLWLSRVSNRRPPGRDSQLIGSGHPLWVNRVRRAWSSGDRMTGVHRKATLPALEGVSRSGILVTPHQPRRMTMEIQAQVVSSTPRREPWNKGKLIGQKPRCGQNTFGQSAPDCRWTDARETWQCSIWRSTASCGAAMSSHFGSRTLHRAGMRSIAPQCGRRKPVGPLGLS